MNTETGIFEAELKAIQELQAKARKYDELKVAVGKIEVEITNIVPNTVSESNIILNALHIIDKHTEGLLI